MVDRINGYDYHVCSNKQDVISSIIESRLVPRDMTGITKLDYAKALLEKAFIFVDNNGKSTKISMTDLSDNVFKIVEEIPDEANIGQIVLHRVGEGQYELMRLDENSDWQSLHLVSDASIINYINTNAHLLSTNVQEALDELDNHLEDDYWQKKHIKDIALTGEAVDVAIAPIEGLQTATNLQEALEEIFNKTTVGFNVKLNADKIQLYLDYGINKKVLGARVVEGSLNQTDLDQPLNQKLDTIYPNQERIEKLEERCSVIEDIKADKTDVTDKYTELKNRLAAEEARSTNYDAKLQGELDAEIQRAQNAEAKLAQDLEAEVNRATSTEAANKQELQTNINNEEASRIREDNALSNRINEEIDRAEAQETELQQRISEEVQRAKAAEERETGARKAEDQKLQDQIDAINSKSDVVDVVGTKQELLDYTKPITDNDIVKVLKDESQNNATAYYRYVGSGAEHTWVFIGTQGPYYTEAEADSRFVNREVTINGHALTSNIRLRHEDIDDNPTIGDARITITKNNVELNHFNLNDTTDTKIDIYVPTKLSEFTDDLGSTPTHTHDQYDTIQSVNEKVAKLNTSINLKADKSNTYTIADVDALMKVEKDARVAEDLRLDGAKQGKLVPGDNITLDGDKISAKDTYYYPGNGITFDEYSGHTDAKSISVDTSLLTLSFENVTGNPTDNVALNKELESKATKTELNTQVAALDVDIKQEAKTRAEADTAIDGRLSNLDARDISVEDELIVVNW